MKKYVTAQQLDALIHGITHGKFFSLIFRRVVPKCLSCGAKSKKWLVSKPTVCPHCGGVVSYEREALAQTGVCHPADKSITPKGIGETFAEKRQKGLIGFYDPIAKGYRECRLENIKRLVYDGNEYEALVQ